MLNQLPVLIVEDEALIALDLVEAIIRVEGVPVGPVATVAEAMRLIDLQPVKAAILDANLLDRDVTPLALALIERDIPFVIHTGTGLPEELSELHPNLVVVLKPARTTLVLAALLHRISPDREEFSGDNP